MTTFTFPENFLWGTATAAYQIEGAAHEGGRTDSIWDTFSRVPGAVLNGETGDVACDHYHRMAEDVEILAELGVNTYRFSTSWARVCPDGGAPNPEGLKFYSRLVDALLEKGIKPWLTLYHWDLPQALQDQGGWTNRETAYRFADYAETVYNALGDRVQVWTTLNEPWCATFLSYAGGHHAPGHTSPSEAVDAVHHILLAHGLATQRLRKLNPELTIGITTNHSVVDPHDPQNAGDVDAARRIDGAFNRVFLDPLFKGEYPADVLADMAAAGLGKVAQPGDMEIISTPIDVLGVNYYNGSEVAAPADGSSVSEPTAESFPGPGGRPEHSPFVGSEGVRFIDRGLPKTAMEWEIQPEGLTRLLTRLHEDYTGPAGIPLVVTENGAAFFDEPDENDYVDDQNRLEYIRQHLVAVHAANEAGANVAGYLVWSLLDNYEWAFGYSRRFGIVRVDYETQKRTPKASARWYAQVARSGVIEAE